MEKINFNYFNKFVCYLCIFSIICNPVFSLAACPCPVCIEEETEETIDIEELGEFAKMFLEFESEADANTYEDDEYVSKDFFIKKWCRKVKRWFKKKLASTLKRLLKMKNINTPDQCAYFIADLKRKIDKKVYNTGKIDIFLYKMKKNFPDSEKKQIKNAFAERIKYYYKNEHARPKKFLKTNMSNKPVNPELKEQLDNLPPRVIFGYVEIGCGFLICLIPFPGCRKLGASLMAHGAYQVYEGRMTEYERENGWKSAI